MKTWIAYATASARLQMVFDRGSGYERDENVLIEVSEMLLSMPKPADRASYKIAITITRLFARFIDQNIVSTGIPRLADMTARHMKTERLYWSLRRSGRSRRDDN